MTFRVWLDSGRWVAVDAPDERTAIRKLTRTQRRHALKVVPVRQVRP